MAWERFFRILDWLTGGRVSPDAADPLANIRALAPNVTWLEAGRNPWGVRVLDVRPMALNAIAFSMDPQQASNAVSYGQEDGTSFIGEEPPSARVIKAEIRFPIDRLLADGTLFIPKQMEHRWALFYHAGQIICVRSWLRQVQVVARVEEHAGYVEIKEVRGTFESAAHRRIPTPTDRLHDRLPRIAAIARSSLFSTGASRRWKKITHRIGLATSGRVICRSSLWPDRSLTGRRHRWVSRRSGNQYAR